LWHNFPVLTPNEMDFVMDMALNGINALPQLLKDLKRHGRCNPIF
jgi:hypothetical protein